MTKRSHTNLPEDIDLYKEILWVMKYYGSDVEERKKLESQAARICEFVRQREEAHSLLLSHKLDLVRIVPFHEIHEFDDGASA